MRGLFLVLIATLATSCSSMSDHYRSPKVSGFAIDAKTGTPVAGLTVTVNWHAIRLTHDPSRPDMLYIHTGTTVTDTNGAFVIPAWGPVSYPRGWRYFLDDPVASFSKSGQNLGYYENQANGVSFFGGSFGAVHPFPFITVNFGHPSWNGQKLKVPNW